MREGRLEFRVSQPLTFEACAKALADIMGVPAKVDVGETDGNPYDTFWRSVEIRATRATGDFVTLWLTQNVSSSTDDPQTVNHDFGLRWYLPNETAEEQARIADAVRSTFAALGCTGD